MDRFVLPDAGRYLGTLNRYRFMFRVSLAAIAVSVLVLAVGMLVWMRGEMPPAVPAALIILDLAGLTAYKVLNSTARILDHVRVRDTKSGGGVDEVQA
jgi:hypothetical protein